MANTVADYVIERLRDWGVQRVFGYPGDGINGFMGALDRADGKPRFVSSRHEEIASFMACAHSKFTGGLGVCMATSGPGAIHLLNGLYDAAADHVPVLAIVGQQATTALGSDYQQEVDLTALFKDVAGAYCQMCVTPSQARQLVDRAIRISLSERAVTCLVFPNDLQEMPYEEPTREHGAVFTGIGWRPPVVIPRAQDLDDAAAVLNAGSRVAILVGAGARGAADELVEVADRLGAGVAKALLGKDVLPDDLPWSTGSIGLLGTKPSDALMQRCDTLLMVGTTFPYTEWLPKPGRARAVQIDLSARNLSMRYPVEVPLVGDARDTLRALLPRLVRKEDRSFRESVEADVVRWEETLAERAAQAANPINPQQVFRELSPRLPDRAVVTADSGTAANWYARDLRFRTGMSGSLSGGLATMGPALPYGLSAKFAFPDRPVVCCVGDGAMQMLGNAVLVDVARYWKEWADPRFVVLVVNNRDLNMVTWEQRVMTGIPRFADSQDVPSFDYAGYARMLGLEGVEMKRPEDVVPGWERAMAARRPVVIDAWTDPETAPLPPHITLEEARNFLGSMLKGAAGVLLGRR
jgi:pyruvate dehydrogenase (quinone)